MHSLRNQSSDYENWEPVQRAARTIYLNRTCYNGLYRVNSKGHFNVPFGDYKNPKIVDSNNLRACSSALQAVDLMQADFVDATEDAQAGDFIYFDPPYLPISKTASFTSYTKRGFDLGLHKLLAATCKKLDGRGVQFLCSNSYCDFILGLYRNFRIEVVEAKRAINSKADRRSGAREVLIRNY